MSDRSDLNRTVRDIADGIGDDSSVNWDEAMEREPGSAGTLEGLRLIERVAMAHRSARNDGYVAPVADSPGHETPLFDWGTLRVLEKIGEGGFAEVYRAFDTSLRRHVALKLRRVEDSEGLSSPWIEEARRLAQVRHPNVLVIHGAAIHDDREGIWTDLILGTTLAEWVEDRGPLGAREAAIAVMDVCRALAAVHGSGLVHGDVKASNIMRESGGRLVLMDFGSGHRLDDSDGKPSSSTPLISAPELLEGDSTTAASDVYSLGVLLYWLVSCRYPFEAESIDQLRLRMRDGKSVSLRERRPDLPRGFIAIIERSIAPDAARRWGGPSELEAALAGFLAASFPAAAAAPQGRRAPRWLWAAVVAAVLGGATLLWSTLNPDPVDPVPDSRSSRMIAAGHELSVDMAMVHVVDGALMDLQPGSPLAPGMQLALRINCDVPAHVYVLNEDEAGDLFVLFPVDDVDLANPLEAGRSNVLPGRRDDRQQGWVVTSAGGVERFMTVVSREPLPSLERAIADLRRVSAGRAVSDPLMGRGFVGALRGVGGIADVEYEAAGHDSTLDEIAAILVASTHDPEGLWVWGVSFPNRVSDSVGN